ncbi:hypothetical protein PTSG_02168 [Salpingoeca rosetta]|uniref:Uncharacterized protein n=1 Tax=Salpingoeca rosetta (strain ATCC 50818 / BSB-021) TaxID=946362 RepID=F2U1E5_SALR5|nr:uncharacterized protein PTSG_02168 [Salpingoeca rosetta]EGD81447.1 hypothetical protein PTSG_02168 [Salpingoeca rosetta]|eukprot:XP_004996651.1 hypothetical protein PTSG_02168 [Salpingoeca rosetta]
MSAPSARCGDLHGPTEWAQLNGWSVGASINPFHAQTVTEDDVGTRVDAVLAACADTSTPSTCNDAVLHAAYGRSDPGHRHWHVHWHAVNAAGRAGRHVRQHHASNAL